VPTSWKVPKDSLNQGLEPSRNPPPVRVEDCIRRVELSYSRGTPQAELCSVSSVQGDGWRRFANSL